MNRVLFFTLTLVCAVPTDAQTIKLATLAPEGSVWHDALVEMSQRWQDITGGALDVRIYPGGVAGDDEAAVRKIRIGQLQAAALTADGMASIAPEMRIFQTPLLIRDDAELDYLRRHIEGELEALAESAGFEILAWSDVGWVYLFSKAPVVRPDDMRRLKLWISPGDAAWARALESAGYHPVALPATEILGGLQSGLLEAFNAPPVAALSSQWFGVARNMTNLRWSPLQGAVVISSKAWATVSEGQQRELRAAAREATERARAEIRDFELGAISAMQRYGLAVHEVNAEDRAQFEAEIRASYSHLVGPSVPTAIFETAQRHLDEYRSTR